MYSFHPTFKAHRWTGVNDYFCISSESWLAMGGGGGGFAFQIDDELDAGESNPSDTFGSPRLSSNEFFRCGFVWTLGGGSRKVALRQEGSCLVVGTFCSVSFRKARWGLSGKLLLVPAVFLMLSGFDLCVGVHSCESRVLLCVWIKRTLKSTWHHFAFSVAFHGGIRPVALVFSLAFRTVHTIHSKVSTPCSAPALSPIRQCLPQEV